MYNWIRITTDHQKVERGKWYEMVTSIPNRASTCNMLESMLTFRTPQPALSIKNVKKLKREMGNQVNQTMEAMRMSIMSITCYWFNRPSFLHLIFYLIKKNLFQADRKCYIHHTWVSRISTILLAYVYNFQHTISRHLYTFHLSKK